MRIFPYLLIVFFLFFIFFPSKIYAESSYVLPYPSSMPGNLIYKFHLVSEKVLKYWYFGDFGQFDYSLKLADKYLVEAKTLFEYKQYLLAYNALKKSDFYFVQIMPSLEKARKKNKNISQKNVILQNASQKHIDVLEKLKIDLPPVFIWQPEKESSTSLYIEKYIENSIEIRKNNL